MSLANGRFLQDKALQPLCQRLAGPGRDRLFPTSEGPSQNSEKIVR